MGRLVEIDGLPVVDARRSFTLHVTAKDIRGASTQEPGNCAIAKACRRELSVIEARIHLSRTYLRTNEGNWMRYLTPLAARDEIIAFDRGGKFESAEFEFKAIPKRERLGTKRRGGKATGKGKKRRKPHVVTNVRSGPA
jgi:hypothetical protein